MIWSDIAAWQGNSPNNSGRRSVTKGLVLHIAEGSYAGTIAWGRNPSAGVSYHFVIAKDGSLAQTLDTDLVAWTQANGNGEWLSVEFEGRTGDSLTPAALESAARLYARTVVAYGAPLALANSPSQRGLGHHSMGGAAWGNHPQCLPLDLTEVLTRNGWVSLRDVTVSTELASYSVDSGLISFDRPIEIVPAHQANTVSVAGLEMTADHRLYVHRSDHPSRKVLEARELKGKRTNWLIPNAGQSIEATGVDIDLDLLRLLVWVQADGHYQMKNGNLDHLHFHFSKERKVNRVVELLTTLGKDHKLSRRTDGTTVIKVYGVEWLRQNVLSWLPDKLWAPWLLSVSTEQFSAINSEITQADGTESGGQRFYFTSVKENADLVQALYITHGKPASIYGPSENGGYTVNLHTKSHNGFTTRDSYKESRTGVTVGCVTTVNDTILIRQNGRAVVVGNCPGQPIINQKPAILARAQQILGGGGNHSVGSLKGTTMYFVRLSGKQEVFLSNGLQSMWLSPQSLADFKTLAGEGRLDIPKTDIRSVGNRGLLGVIIGTVPPGYTVAP